MDLDVERDDGAPTRAKVYVRAATIAAGFHKYISDS
jgi:hypothetical protein